MRLRYTLFLVSSLSFSSSVFAQLVGDNAFLQGRWLEVGIAANGSWGNTVAVPPTYHTNAFGFSSGYTDPGTGTTPPSTTAIDFSYDANHDGWGVGSPTFYGPYYMPGTPFDGWSMQVNGMRSDAYYTTYGFYSDPGSTLTGTVSSYNYFPANNCKLTPSSMVGTWTGTAGPGGALQVTQSNRLDTNADWLVVTTKFVNTSATAQPALYYFVDADPDNVEVFQSGTGFTTVNHIAYQGDAQNRHEVWSRPQISDAHQDCFAGLATKDCRAKALIYTGWASYPARTPGNSLDNVWNETPTGGMGPAWYTLGSTTINDIAYGLIFKLGDLAPGDSTVLSFAWIFSDTLAIDSAFPGPLGLVTQGTLHPPLSIDSVFLCGLSGCGVVGKTFTADILEGDTKDWSFSHWTWTPSTGLSATTGTHVVVDFAALSGPTTYTITGVKDTAHGQCSAPVTFYLFAQPCFNATSNSPGPPGVTICMNETLSLQAHGDSTGASYFWYGPGGFTAFTQYTTRTGLTMADTGIYHVVRTVGSAHDTATAHVALKALPVVTATSNGPVCSGNPNTLLLFANPDSTGETFNWTGPDGFSSILQNPTWPNPPVAGSGIYKVVTHWNGCNDSNTVVVVIDSTPALPTVSGNSPLCSSHPQNLDTLKLFSSDVTPGSLYSWAGPGGFTSGLQNPAIPNVHVPASGVYTVTAFVPYDGLTCSTTNTYTVLVDSTPFMPVLGSNAPICSGNALLLTATSTDLTPTFTTNYRWGGPDAFISALQNPTISPASTFATGIYSVTATIAYPGIIGGCTSDTGLLTVVVDSTPQVPNVTSNSPSPPGICQGDTLKLFSSDSTALVSYSWAGPAGFSSTLENPFIAPVGPAATGVYTVTAILGPCSSSAVTTVTITPTPVITATNNGPICTGVTDTLFLQAASNPGTTFSWTGPYTFVSSAQNPYRTPAIHEYSGIYQAISYLNGCPSLPVNDTVIINNTPPAPWVSWLTFCQSYDAPRLQAFGDSIMWYPSSTPGVAGTMVAPIPPTASDTVMWFFVTQTKMACMSALDSFKVTINPKPTVTISPSIGVCPHDTAIITAVDADPIAYYHWAPAMYLSDTVGPSVIVRPETNVIYTVVATNKYNCTDTANVMVTVKPAALLTINVGDSVVLYPGETYQIDPMTNCSYFTWFPPAGLSNAQISNPVASPEISTKYTVQGTTNWGCIAEDSLNVYVSPESLLALPNAFTPGNGPNNTFKVIKRGIATLNYFRIFDRWGVMVFETKDIDKGWDGAYNGTMQPYGVYVYQISAVTSAGRSFEKHGNVTLIK